MEQPIETNEEEIETIQLVEKEFPKKEAKKDIKVVPEKKVPVLKLPDEVCMLIDDRVAMGVKVRTTKKTDIIIMSLAIAVIVFIAGSMFMPSILGGSSVSKKDFTTNMTNVAKDIAKLNEQVSHIEQVDRNFTTQQNKSTADVTVLQQKLAVAEQTIKSLQDQINALKAK